MTKAEYKLQLWGNTLKGADIYPLGRTDEYSVYEHYRKSLHAVMHRAGEQQEQY